MIAIEKEDWIELVKILKSTEESLTALTGTDTKAVEQSRQSLQSFHTTAAMFGLDELQRIGQELEKYLTGQIAPGGSVDAIAAFGFAVSSLVDQMKNAVPGEGAGSIDVEEILEILGPPASGEGAGNLTLDDLPPSARSEAEAAPEEPAAQMPGSAAEFARLGELVKSWGGELMVLPNGESGGKFSLTFSGSAESLGRLEKLLSASAPSPIADQETAASADSRIEKVLAKGRELMDAFSENDMARVQDILASLSDPQYQTGLYKQIGGVARGLHDSIRTFLHTLDPTLKEMVEDKIPDSGNRLEHMLELTEKAAITTLDHVDAMQERLGGEQEKVVQLRSIIGGLKAIGDQAEQKLSSSGAILNGLDEIIEAHRTDLNTILTAQDYQDLSGQIILKIMNLLKDLELKLVNLIRTFGVKVEAVKPQDDELYGPAHSGREDAVHSQDEVDSLLAEFGF